MLALGTRARDTYSSNLVSIAYSPLVPAARQGRSGDGICAVSAGSGLLLRASSVARPLSRAAHVCVSLQHRRCRLGSFFVYPRDSGESNGSTELFVR